MERFIDRLFLQLAFPNNMDAPSLLFETANIAFIAFDVTLEFRNPVLEIGLRHGRMAVWTAVPKASVDENAYLLSRVGDIRPSRDLPLETISAQARGAETLPDDELGLGIFALIALHALSHGGSNDFARRGSSVQNTTRATSVPSYIGKMLTFY